MAGRATAVAAARRAARCPRRRPSQSSGGRQVSPIGRHPLRSPAPGDALGSLAGGRVSTQEGEWAAAAVAAARLQPRAQPAGPSPARPADWSPSDWPAGCAFVRHGSSSRCRARGEDGRSRVVSAAGGGGERLVAGRLLRAPQGMGRLGSASVSRVSELSGSSLRSETHTALLSRSAIHPCPRTVLAHIAEAPVARITIAPAPQPILRTPRLHTAGGRLSRRPPRRRKKKSVFTEDSHETRNSVASSHVHVQHVHVVT